MRLILAIIGTTLFCNVSAAQWTRQQSGTTARLRGLAVVNAKVVWASGAQGTYARTTDGGITWKSATVPGAADLDFRDIHACDEHKAFLLSIGAAEKSRIYHTADGGNTWALRFINHDPRGFLDAIAFWDDDHGIAMGDPVDGRFTILTTGDGGVNWKKSPSELMPLAKKSEGAFAASGTCLVVQGDRNAWFGTGGAAVSRVFRTADRGQTWTVDETPIAAASPSSGVFSLAFRDQNDGVAVGGDYKNPAQANRVVALTADGGRTWTLPKGRGPGGYRSGVAYVPGSAQPTLVAVGPTGSDLSTDGGQSWMPLGTLGFHTVGFAGPTDGGWGAGDDGIIAKIRGALPTTANFNAARPTTERGSVSPRPLALSEAASLCLPACDER
jgi:photosystem II stability/assembly factor-like uncharacterized protein